MSKIDKAVAEITAHNFHNKHTQLFYLSCCYKDGNKYYINLQRPRYRSVRTYNLNGGGDWFKDTGHLSLIDACRHFNIDFRYGNDAPRNGKHGDYIVITKRGAKRITQLTKALNKNRPDVSGIDKFYNKINS